MAIGHIKMGRRSGGAPVWAMTQMSQAVRVGVVQTGTQRAVVSTIRDGACLARIPSKRRERPFKRWPTTEPRGRKDNGIPIGKPANLVIARTIGLQILWQYFDPDSCTIPQNVFGESAAIKGVGSFARKLSKGLG